MSFGLASLVQGRSAGTLDYGNIMDSAISDAAHTDNQFTGKRSHLRHAYPMAVKYHIELQLPSGYYGREVVDPKSGDRHRSKCVPDSGDREHLICDLVSRPFA